jgi:ectoine/hydroxyectoine ABC transporter solute-binding protein
LPTSRPYGGRRRRQGFRCAPDVAREVFKRLGVPDVVASISEYGAMIPGLQAGRFDVVTAGLFMKPERCAAVAYSEPVLCDAEAMLVKKGNPKGFKSYADVANDQSATIGAPGGGTEEKLALEAGVPRDRVIVVPDGQSGLKMLQDGRIDAYSLPVLSINDLVKKANDPNLEVIAPVQGAPVYCDGAAFKKGDEALRDAFDVELAKLKDIGRVRQDHRALRLLGRGGDVDDPREALRGEVALLSFPGRRPSTNVTEGALQESELSSLICRRHGWQRGEVAKKHLEMAEKAR